MNFFEKTGIIFDSEEDQLEEFFNNSAANEYVYAKTASLIREGKTPEEAQAEVLREVAGIIEGSVLSEEDAKIEVADEEQK